MTLTQLSTKLKTTTGTDIKQVYFDYSNVANQSLVKEYPYVWWAMDNATLQPNLSTGTETITLDAFCVQSCDINTDNQITKWDAAIAAFNTYIAMINNLADLSVNNYTTIEKELFPYAVFSNDGEVAVRFRIILKSWC